MFERASVSPIRPTRTLADVLLLRPVPAPGPDAVWSLSSRPVLMAVRGDGWLEVPVLAWAWNPAGDPVLWQCAVDLGTGQVGWFAYDVRKGDLHVIRHRQSVEHPYPDAAQPGGTNRRPNPDSPDPRERPGPSGRRFALTAAPR